MLIGQLADRIEACPELIEADKILWNDETLLTIEHLRILQAAAKCILDIIDEVIVEGNVE